MAQAGGARVAAAVDIRRGDDRPVTRSDGLLIRHSFSFSSSSSGRHDDPVNTSFGALLLHDDIVLGPGAGFAPHPHHDVEVVTWVLEGALVHEDSAGHAGVVHPGGIQRMSAGSGVVHAERNSGEEPLRFVQVWVRPDEPGGDPGHAQRDVGDQLAHGGLVPVVSGLPRHDAPVGIGTRHAALHAARLRPGDDVVVPDAPYVHVFVPRGHVVLEEAGALREGDAARLTAAGARRVTASTDAELLVWEMHAGPWRPPG